MTLFRPRCPACGRSVRCVAATAACCMTRLRRRDAQRRPPSHYNDGNSGESGLSTFTSQDIEGSDDIGLLFSDLYRRGYTDGLPVIPPTEERVQAMLDHAGMKPGEVI